MSLEEDDASLKELVTKTLQTNGVLGKIQAQLRASVFLALEEEFKAKNMPIVSASTKQLLATPEGALAAALVHNFLQCLSLDFSLAVFAPESGHSTLWTFPGEDALTSNLDLNNKQDGNKAPLLVELLKERTATKSSDLETSRDKAFVSKGRSLNELGPLPQLTAPRTLQPISNFPSSNNHFRGTSTFSSKKDVKNDLSKNNEAKKETGIFSSDNAQENNMGVSLSQGNGLTSAILTSDAEKARTRTSTNLDEKEERPQTCIDAASEEANNSLTGLEKQYEDDFSSMSEKEGQDDGDDEDIEEEEEEIEEAEDIDEDISLDDLINSSASINSDHTKDQSLSQASDAPNYQEDL